VAGMKVGGKRQLHIPPDLGYGENGSPDGSIPPNSALIFDVQLLSIQDPPQ
jgi:FKBP-type peptidyl-prolyl cis-trans isomerase FkpA